MFLADMFRHKNLENWTKIEKVMALTIKIFQITQCNGKSIVHEKQKSQKLKKILLPGPIPAVFFVENHLSIYKRIEKKIFSAYIQYTE